MRQNLANQQFRERKINALEPGDTYKTDKVHKFREEVIDPTKPLFMNRIKSESGLLPMFSGINDPVPKETMEKMRREQAKLLVQESEAYKKPLLIGKSNEA